MSKPEWLHGNAGFLLVMANLLAVAPAAGDPPSRPRARDVGIVIGELPTGKLNAITDVEGVRVGHTTVVEGDSIRTGVTVVLPHGGNLFQEKVPGAVHVGNAFGKLVGATQVRELGNIESPIALTNTLNVWKVADALAEHMLGLPGNEAVRSVNVLVGETNDGGLNAIRGRAVNREHVLAALRAAATGQVPEGTVGAGTGTICFGWKGGIGTASRVVSGFSLGVLVQTNYGGSLTIAGVPVHKRLSPKPERGTGRESPRGEDGSCMIVVATDAPLDSRNLERLAQRALAGMARTGSSFSNGSGDYVIAFSTARELRIRHGDSAPPAASVLSNDAASPLFKAVIEATEEAIINSMFKATDVTSRLGSATAIPVDRVLACMLSGPGVDSPGNGSAKKPEIVTIAEAQGTIARNSEAAMVELNDGRLFMVWQEFEKGDGDSDFFPGRLAAMTSADGGRKWDNHRVLVKPEKDDINVFSPNLLRLPDGGILFCFMRYHSFAKAQNKYPPASAFAWVSHDEAKSFQPLATLWTEQPITLCNSTLKRLSSGGLLIPVCRDLSTKGNPDHWESGTYSSDDGGKTWRPCENWVDLPKRGAMEPHVEELRDRRILMVMRTQLGAVYRSISTDGGKTWSPGESLGIEAPESCPELIRIPNKGDLLLIWNASRYDPQWASHFGKRTPLSAAVSTDDGQTWSKPRHIETDPGWAFSNPGVCFTRAGTAVIHYWACQYQPSGAMSNHPIHLKGAIVPVDWLYGMGP